MFNFEKKEWKLIFFVSLILIFITTIIPVIGKFYTPEGQYFWGVQTINFADTAVYYSWIEQVKDGHWLFKNLYTSETHPRFLFDIFWLSIGLLAKLFSLSAFTAFQISRILLIPILGMVIYSLTAFFIEDKKQRKKTFLIIMLATGWGFYATIIASFLNRQFNFPLMDIAVVENNIFLMAYYSPHFIFSVTLITLTFLLMLKSWEKNKIKYSILSGITALILFNFHPYYVPTIYTVLFFYLVFLIIKNKKIDYFKIKSFFILFFLSLPSVIYHLWTIKTFYIRQQHTIQNNLHTPSFLNLTLSYGAIFILAILGVAFLIKNKKTDKIYFLLIWPLTLIFLMYNPAINYQRKLIESLSIPLSILAANGLSSLKLLFPKIQKLFINRLVLGGIYLLIFGMTNIFILITDINFYTLNTNPYFNAYIEKNKKDAMQWARQLPEGVFLAGYNNSNIIPAFAVKQVYMGHWGMTANAIEKIKKQNYFFQKATPEEQEYFIKQNNIKYIFYSNHEKSFYNFKPINLSILKKIYDKNEVQIYETTN